MSSPATTDGGASPSRWAYLPALDGVRALAVVAVVLFHVWPDRFGGGFVGVDVFFVLSGYLITAMAMAEHDRTGRLDLRAFWGRRVRRLVPAVLVLVAVCAVASAVLGTASARGIFNSIGALTWSTNWLELHLSGQPWWATDTRTLLDHLWSLAVEEQFYVVWPLVLVVVLGRTRGLAVRVAMLGAVVVASAAVSGWLGYPAAYFRTDARAFELVLGAILAVTRWRPGPRTGGTLVVMGASVLIAFVGTGSSTDPVMYPWGLLGLGVAAVALIAGATAPPRWVLATLASRPARHLGQVSYGVYLWHIPVVRVLHPGRVDLDGPALLVLRLVVLAALVEASWRLVERPLRAGGGSRRAPIMGLALVSVASLALLVPGASRSVDRQWYVADNRPAPQAATGQRRVLVVGDLVAGIVGDGLASSGRGLSVWNTSDLGCPLGLDGRPDPAGGVEEPAEFCRHWPERWGEASDRFEPDVVVVASGVWDTLPWTVGGRVLRGDELDRFYADLAAKQVAVASQRQGDGLAGELVPVVLVVVDDVGELAPPEQPAGAERRDRARRYARALEDAARGRSHVDVIRVEGAPDFETLRSRSAAAVADRLAG